jgi:hypothetical protein
VHDPVSGTIATATKEELLLEIERQRSLGDAGLLEEDKYLAEVNVGVYMQAMITRLVGWKLEFEYIQIECF